MSIITSFDNFFNKPEKINYSDIDDIMYYLTDEFSDVSYSIEGSLHSSIIQPDSMSFIIEITNNDGSNLYYLEPKIFDITTDIDSQLKRFGLEIFYSDFGKTDTSYELVITKIGNKPKFISSRYDQDGNPR